MAQYITEIEKEGDLGPALATFSAVCVPNATELGLLLPDLAEIAEAATDYNEKLDAWYEIKSASQGAKTAKDDQKKTSKGIVAKWAKVFRANPDVSDELLAQLMLPPHKTPASFPSPAAVTGLVAQGDGTGSVKLSWKRNGNRPNTVFLVEFRSSASASWMVMGACTKARFETKWTPGTYVAFRVTAQRGDQSSASSAPVVLWDTPTPVELKIAA